MPIKEQIDANSRWWLGLQWDSVLLLLAMYSVLFTGLSDLTSLSGSRAMLAVASLALGLLSVAYPWSRVPFDLWAPPVTLMLFAYLIGTEWSIVRVMVLSALAGGFLWTSLSRTAPKKENGNTAAEVEVPLPNRAPLAIQKGRWIVPVWIAMPSLLVGWYARANVALGFQLVVAISVAGVFGALGVVLFSSPRGGAVLRGRFQRAVTVVWAAVLFVVWLTLKE